MEFLILNAPYLLIFYLAVLLAVRPSRSAWLASLLGGLVMGALNLAGDLLAYSAHWWHYSFKPVTLQSTPDYLVPLLHAFQWMETNLHISLPFYLTPILIFGSLAYLLVWRFWSGRSRWLAILFLIGSPLFCILRDILGGLNNTSFQIWDNLPAALIGTIAMWLLAFFIGFLLFRQLAPPRVSVEEKVSSASLSSPQIHKQ